MEHKSNVGLRSELIAQARAVRIKAYAPYSNFLVGAALIADDGQIYCGCNVENAAYPEGTCAEAGAIAAMIAGGGRKIEMIAVVAGGERLVSPCGGCRQRLAEFSEPAVAVHLAKPQGEELMSYSVEQLLPVSFEL